MPRVTEAEGQSQKFHPGLPDSKGFKPLRGPALKTCLAQSWGGGRQAGAGEGNWAEGRNLGWILMSRPSSLRRLPQTTAPKGQWLCLGLLRKCHRPCPTPTECRNMHIRSGTQFILPAPLWVRDSITVLQIINGGSERCSHSSKVTKQRLNPDLDSVALPLPRAPPAPVA